MEIIYTIWVKNIVKLSKRVESMEKQFWVNRRNFIYAFLFLGLAVCEWILGMVLYNNVDSLNYEFIMFVYEWLIVFTLVATCITWKKIQEFWISPYIILYLFLMIFNAGQFIMWAFGIHYVTRMSSELGVATHIRFMDHQTLMRIVFITLPAVTFFYFGTLVSTLGEKKEQVTINEVKNILFQKWIKRIGICVLIISYLVAIYDTVSDFSFASLAGYTSLYYGDTRSSSALLKYISYMFLPSFFATYVGFQCSKKAFKVLTILIIPYIAMNLIMGDRGSCIYFICLWAWCYSQFYSSNNHSKMSRYEKREKRKRVIKIIIIAIVLLIPTMIFYKYRDIGFNTITLDDIKMITSDMSYMFIKPFFEMGQSARCLGIVIQDNLNKIWDGGNTYIAGIVSMALPRIKLLFGFYDNYFENWFSQSYLGIQNYGLGFTAIAEAYLNGGMIFYPLYMILFGFFIGKITNYKAAVGLINYKSLYFVLGSTVTIITACRGSIELSLRKWFYGCLLIYLIVNFLVNLQMKKR